MRARDKAIATLATWLMFVVLLLTAGTATAHPLDVACLRDPAMTEASCKALHDKATGDPTQSTFDRLAQARSKFPSRQIGESAPLLDVIKRFVGLGFVHILPRGLDHILFVLALFLGASTWRQLLLQVSAFTLAHSVTLALAALNLISVPAAIVEPLIALSIAFLAIENVVFKQPPNWRIVVIFGFGLFHGLGFAGVLGELGLEKGKFLTSLISFNVGVEFGQLCVILLASISAFFLRRVLTDNQVPQLYGQILVTPLSILIALIGLWWAFERVFLAG